MSRAPRKGQYTPLRAQLVPPDRFRLAREYGLERSALPVATAGVDHNHERRLPSDEGLD